MVKLRINGFYKKIADKPQQQQPRHKVHGNGISLGGGQLQLLDLPSPQQVDQLRAKDGRRRPSQQQPAVNGPDFHHPKHVPQVGRDGGKAAAVHAHDNAERRHEANHTAHLPSEWHQEIEQRPQEEENGIGIFPANPVTE